EIVSEIGAAAQEREGPSPHLRVERIGQRLPVVANAHEEERSVPCRDEAAGREDSAPRLATRRPQGREDSPRREPRALRSAYGHRQEPCGGPPSRPLRERILCGEPYRQPDQQQAEQGRFEPCATPEDEGPGDEQTQGCPQRSPPRTAQALTGEVRHGNDSSSPRCNAETALNQLGPRLDSRREEASDALQRCHQERPQGRREPL